MANLPEPSPLQNRDACSEEFQDDVVSQEDFKEDAQGSGKEGSQKQGMDMLVQHGSVGDVEVEKEACGKASPCSEWQQQKKRGACRTHHAASSVLFHHKSLEPKGSYGVLP